MMGQGCARRCTAITPADPGTPRTMMSPAPPLGMRQEVYRHHAGRPGYRLVTRSASYITDMATAKFCLAPTGGGHGKRQVH